MPPLIRGVTVRYSPNYQDAEAAYYEDALYCDDGWSVEVAAARHEADVLTLGEIDEAAYRDSLYPASVVVAPVVAVVEDEEPF